MDGVMIILTTNLAIDLEWDREVLPKGVQSRCSVLKPKDIPFH